MKIYYLKNQEINFKAYNFCVENSTQGTIYAMSWYLNITSPGWELLMADDYNYVMPIPVKKKYFFKYAIQPPLCQQLGVFSLKELTSEVFNCFIEAIPYRYCNFFLNSENVFDEFASLKFNSNYELDLRYSHEEIRAGFSTNCIRNIKKAEKENLSVENQTDEKVYIDFVMANCGDRPIKHLIHVLQHLIEGVDKNSKIEIWNVRNGNHEILSCVLFVRWTNRFYYLVPISSTEGKLKQSMSFLLDMFIQRHAKSGFVLDFEGSSIPNIARYYESFGSQNKPYPKFVKTNKFFDLLVSLRFK
ncbi:MAG: hypothetical protein FWD60_03160 [Candidatus Azobacteroides sp.]|nr:hypothetical protein [Candidatus Azobacteroides sp.]